MTPPSLRPPADNVADWIQEAEAAYAKGRFAAALHLFRQALSHDPEDANLQAASARCLRQLGEHAEARRILEAILQRQPDQFAAVLGMAELLLSGGEPAAALPFYRRAVAGDPRNLPLLRTFSHCLLAAREPGEAEQVLKPALEIEPHDPQLLSAWIDLCQTQGDHQQALALSGNLLTLAAASPWHRLRHARLSGGNLAEGGAQPH